MSDSQHPLVITLMGPTASGKTSLAMELCEHLPCDIISVDSALVYRGMNIGSAKPTAEELSVTPHRLVDIRDPSEPYSAAEFRADALQTMAEIVERGRIPLLVGGTMLYFKALLEGMASMPAADASVRAVIEKDAAEHGWPYVHAQLAEVDPESAARIHPNHSQRIERALEVYRVSGMTMTEHHQAQQTVSDLPYRFIQLAITPKDRSVLHQRIEQRFQHMLELGFVDEVRALRARPDIHCDLSSMRAVGYRQVWEYLDGQWGETEMLERGVIATRQLAKRQLTWLRGWPDLHWLETDEQGLVETEQGQKETPLQAALKIIPSGKS